MRTVALEQAYRWLCPDCGHMNFEAGETVPKEDLEEMGIDIEEGEVVTCPNTVLCEKCLSHFATEEFGEEIS